MLVVCELMRNGIDGRKVRELCDFLQKHIACRVIEDDLTFKKMCLFVRRQVNDLNAMYSDTVTISFKCDFTKERSSGTLCFYRPGSPTPFVHLQILSVTKYEEGGRHV